MDVIIFINGPDITYSPVSKVGNNDIITFKRFPRLKCYARFLYFNIFVFVHE